MIDYPARNKIEMGLRDVHIIDITITATSSEMANQIFSWIEAGLLAMVKIDLERDWQIDIEDGDE